MAVIKFTAHFLHKLEDLFAESDFVLRYEKGSFKSGYCVLKDKKVVLVNAYYPLEGKVNSLVEILRSLDVDKAALSDKSLRLLQEIRGEASATLPLDTQEVANTESYE